jgi:hypothetical protein
MTSQSDNPINALMSTRRGRATAALLAWPLGVGLAKTFQLVLAVVMGPLMAHMIRASPSSALPDSSTFSAVQNSGTNMVIAMAAVSVGPGIYATFRWLAGRRDLDPPNDRLT